MDFNEVKDNGVAMASAGPPIWLAISLTITKQFQ